MKPSKTNPIIPNSPIAYFENNKPTSPSQDVSSLVKRTINEEASIKVYPHCVIYTPIKRQIPLYNRKRFLRSTIKSFSKRSRFRLFETMAKVKSCLVNKPFFVSLTYHYGHQSRELSDKTCLHNFLVSLRDFDNDVQYIWRIDLQKRGAPHYHLIIFPSINEKLHDRKRYIIHVSKIWHHIADPTSKKHAEFGCDIQNISNYRHACSYINKYLAKVPEGMDGLDKGKHWGCSRNLPTKPFKTIELDRWQSGVFIHRVRRWLLNNGKERYANDEYFNEDRPQTVFIDARDFYTIMGDKIENMDFSGL